MEAPLTPAPTGAPGNPGSTARTRVRRTPEKAVPDRAVAHAVLDAGLVAHLAVTDPDGQPYVLPVAYARDGDRVLVHGSTGSRLFRALADGAPTCLTVTLLDGLVLARSAFESSMHYRSVMVLGRCTALADDEEWVAMERITEHLMPGRWADLRQPTRKERAATLVLALGLGECSVKVSDGWPDDPEEDLDLPYWAGVVPMTTVLGTPLPAPNLRGDPPVPPYVARWQR
ncbi:MAG: pyridoxamine 5'-phosphate oxidase family protein [Actinomycetes bacterium]